MVGVRQVGRAHDGRRLDSADLPLLRFTWRRRAGHRSILITTTLLVVLLFMTDMGAFTKVLLGHLQGLAGALLHGLVRPTLAHNGRDEPGGMAVLSGA